MYVLIGVNYCVRACNLYYLNAIQSVNKEQRVALNVLITIYDDYTDLIYFPAALIGNSHL